jgi:hypothetical protein
MPEVVIAAVTVRLLDPLAVLVAVVVSVVVRVRLLALCAVLTAAVVTVAAMVRLLALMVVRVPAVVTAAVTVSDDDPKCVVGGFGVTGCPCDATVGCGAQGTGQIVVALRSLLPQMRP